MSVIKPFKAICPAKDKVHLVTSRTLDNYDERTLHDKLINNPYSFLHVIKPEFGAKTTSKVNSHGHLKKIKNKFEEYIKEGILVQSVNECFYIYQQISNSNTYTGIIGCASIDDYFSGVVKAHEQIIGNRDEKLKEYLKVVNINAEPVVLSYTADTEIEKMLSVATLNPPEYDFTTTDKLRHKLWSLNDDKDISFIVKRFRNISSVYIIDGHHRTASSALLGKELRGIKGTFTGKEGFNFYMAVFFSDKQLQIFGSNRLVKDLNGMTKNEFLDNLKKKFEVVEKGNKPFLPKKPCEFSMYFDKKWYALIAAENIYADNGDLVANLDASILNTHILLSILNIKDLRNKKRIEFAGGILGAEELKKRVDDNKAVAAFGIYPAAMDRLKKIADAGKVMPPKSTWIEPKMRSGLVVYRLSD